MKPVILFIICILSISISYSQIGPSIGDSAELRIWYSRTNNNGGNGINGNISLEKIENASGNELQFSFLFTLEGGESASPFPVPPEGYRITINIANQKPSSVISSSTKFQVCPWITGVSTNFGFNNSRIICFPLLPPDKNYENKDWYTVRLNDTIELYAEYVSEKFAFLGTLKKVRSDDQRNDQIITTSDKYAIYIKNNPFRLGSVVIHSSIPAIIDSQFTNITDGYYGLKIGRYMSSNDILNNRNKNNDRKKMQNLRGYDRQGRKAR